MLILRKSYYLIKLLSILACFYRNNYLSFFAMIQQHSTFAIKTSKSKVGSTQKCNNFHSRWWNENKMTMYDLFLPYIWGKHQCKNFFIKLSEIVEKFGESGWNPDNWINFLFNYFYIYILHWYLDNSMMWYLRIFFSIDFFDVALMRMITFLNHVWKIVTVI